MYSLTTQMRRSAVSIPSNISEGAARKGKQENIQFLYIALGSLSELETQVLISKELGFLFEIASIAEIIERERRKLLNYIKYVKNN